MSLYNADGKGIVIVVDDCDKFLHFRYRGNIPADKVQMESPIKGSSAVDTDATVEKHSSVMPNLIAAHTLTGCNTVASYFGIGKRVTLKVLQKGNACTILLFETFRWTCVFPSVSF